MRSLKPLQIRHGQLLVYADTEEDIIYFDTQGNMPELRMSLKEIWQCEPRGCTVQGSFDIQLKLAQIGQKSVFKEVERGGTAFSLLVARDVEDGKVGEGGQNSCENCRYHSEMGCAMSVVKLSCNEIRCI